MTMGGAVGLEGFFRGYGVPTASKGGKERQLMPNCTLHRFLAGLGA